MSRGLHLGNPAKASVSAPIQCAYDGRYVWVTNTGNTQIFEVWANNIDNTGVNYTARSTVLVGQVQDSVENLPTYDFTDCSFITYGAGYMYIAKKKQWQLEGVTDRSKMLFDTILKVNVNTRKVEEVIRTPISQIHIDSDAPYQHATHKYVMMNSVLHFEEGKLWCVDDWVDAQSNGSQRVYTYDISSGLWSTRGFQAQTQKNRAQITSANGFVYISAYNSLSVLKYNALTGDFVSSLRGNANPNALCATPSGKILVTSDGGLVSHLNTDDTWTHDLMSDTSACTCVTYESDSYIWTVDGNSHLFRIGSDNFVYGSGYKDESGNDTDYTLLTANPMEDDPTKLWSDDLLALQGDMVDTSYNTLQKYSFSGTISYAKFIPSMKYQYWNGTAMVTTTQNGLLVVLTDSEIVVINTSKIKFGFPRPTISRSTMSAVGVGMISYGPNDYTGD